MYLVRKVVLAAMLAAIVGVMAPAAASATYAAPAPDWAGPETDWTGVEVYDCWYDSDLPEPKTGTPCTFTATAPALELTNPNAPYFGHIVTCKVTVEIDVWANGMTRVNSVDIDPGEQLCNAITATSMPWMNQICERESINGVPLTISEYWDAVDIEFSVAQPPPAPPTVVPGTVYLQLHNSGGDTSPLGADYASIDSDIQGSGGYHLEDPDGFLFETYEIEPAFWVASTEEDCGWDFS